jgi:hypothetical protein
MSIQRITFGMSTCRMLCIANIEKSCQLCYQSTYIHYHFVQSGIDCGIHIFDVFVPMP